MIDQLPTILLGPPRYEELMSNAVDALRRDGMRVVPNPSSLPLTREFIAEYGDCCVAVIAGPEPWTASEMDLLPRLRVLAKCGAGVDNIDLSAAQQKGIAVTNTPGANSNAVAEFTVGLMLALLRHIPQAARAMQRGQRRLLAGPELCGKTVGLIGAGHIGQLVARRLSGFDVSCLIYDPFVTVAPPGTVLTEDLTELLAKSDVVSLHLPANEHTKNLVSDAFLRRCKPGAYLINSARGAIVNEAALAHALDEGRIAGAALDVLKDETPGSIGPLHGRENVVLTPHLGAETWEAYSAVGSLNVTDIRLLLAGHPSPRELRGTHP